MVILPDPVSFSPLGSVYKCCLWVGWKFLRQSTREWGHKNQWTKGWKQPRQQGSCHRSESQERGMCNRGRSWAAGESGAVWGGQRWWWRERRAVFRRGRSARLCCGRSRWKRAHAPCRSCEEAHPGDHPTWKRDVAGRCASQELETGGFSKGLECAGRKEQLRQEWLFPTGPPLAWRDELGQMGTKQQGFMGPSVRHAALLCIVTPIPTTYCVRTVPSFLLLASQCLWKLPRLGSHYWFPDYPTPLISSHSSW